MNDIQTNKHFLPLLILLILISVPSSIAQWINKPEDNLQVVSDVLHPENIKALSDGSGGAFVFWEDTKENENKIYFSHFDADGKISFRADGKRVSAAGGKQSNVSLIRTIDGSVLAFWLGVSNDNMNNLFVQKVTSKGSLLWKETGINLTKIKDNLLEYSVDEADSFTVISFLAAEPGFLGQYKVVSQVLYNDGSFSSGLIICQTNNRISSPSALFDGEGGYFVFWLENIDGKGVLKLQHLSSGDTTINSKPFVVSDANQSVDYYSAQPFGLSIAYVCWHYTEHPDELVHNIITDENEFLWDDNSKLADKSGYNLRRINLFEENDKLWLSWIADSSGKTNSEITAINKNGKPVFKNGKKFISLKNSMLIGFTTDNKEGIISGYAKLINDSSSYKIFAQRISSSGNMVWKDDGVTVINRIESFKNNISMAPDLNGGEFFVYYDESDKTNSIYMRKIFSTGTYSAQIFGFHAQAVDDSVKIEWFSANESASVYYILEKHVKNDSTGILWQKLDSVKAKGNSENSFYKFFDKPDKDGTVYYKIIQKDFKGNELYSSETRVNYFINSDRIIVGQNNPNPFTDSTKISFYLPQDADVSVEFFNNKIEKFHKIDKQHFSAGEHDIYFKADSLSPGIYFYKFKSKDFVDVKKMVVTKK